MEAVREMMADLNSLLQKHARGEDTSDDFAEFMEKHGELFPENPQDVDGLHRRPGPAPGRRRADDALAVARAAGRAEPAHGAGHAGHGPRDGDVPALRLVAGVAPGMFRGRQRADIDGNESLGMGDAVGAVSDLADLEALEAQLSQASGPSGLDDVDIEALERQLPASSVRNLEALRDLQAELERQGYIEPGDDGLQLTPKALRRFGETALRRIFQTLDADGSGSHQDPRSGGADERTGAFLPWEFGDERPIDAVRTVQNAVLRRASSGGEAADRHTARRRGLRGGRDDQAHRCGRRPARRPLVLDDPGGPLGADEADRAGAVAPHLEPIPSGRAPDHRVRPDRTAAHGDAAGRGRAAVDPGHQPAPRADARRRHLRRHPEAEPVVLVVTDGEPTAHLEPDGTPTFQWPTTKATLRATVGEVDAITRYGVTLNFFLLGDDPGLARFVDSVARRNGGRVFSPEAAARRVRRRRLPPGPRGAAPLGLNAAVLAGRPAPPVT